MFYRKQQPRIDLTLPLGRWSTPMNGGPTGRFVERLAPGAFAGSLDQGSRVDIRIEHAPAGRLGSTGDRSARVWVADGVLHAETFPGREAVRQVAGWIARGHRFSPSPTMRVTEDHWNTSRPVATRTVTAARLIELSLTQGPAYPNGAVTTHNGA